MGVFMSDLIERVAKAICTANGQEWDRTPETEQDVIRSIRDDGTACGKDDYRNEARAAIKTIAEWLKEQDPGDTLWARHLLRKAMESKNE